MGKLIGVINYHHSPAYITDECVADLFSTYSNGFKSFVYFCLDKFMWSVPVADLLRFKHDPESGEKIDWLKIYELNKKKFYDFSDELDKMFYKEFNKK